MKDRIKLIRKKANLTQTEFGIKLGVRHSTVSQWESGINTPDERSMKAICREFKVNYPWLVEGIGDMYSSYEDSLLNQFAQEYNVSDYELTILRKYLSIPHELRMKVLEFMKSDLCEKKEPAESAGDIKDN